MTQGRVAQITNNANFGNIGNLLSQGHDMDYIARHFHMDLALAWALRLEGKTDQEKFKELGWGLRTWDQWKFQVIRAYGPRDSARRQCCFALSGDTDRVKREVDFVNSVPGGEPKNLLAGSTRG